MASTVMERFPSMYFVCSFMSRSRGMRVVASYDSLTPF